MAMIRGTTAQFKFKLPYTKAELTWATIKFWQPGNMSSLLPITKRLEHCDAPDDSNELCVSLTAEETQRFSEKYKAKLQIRAQHTKSGTVFGSRTQLITVYPMNDEILEEDPTMPSENEEGWVVFDGEAIIT
jgi:hypothetical protein